MRRILPAVCIGVLLAIPALAQQSGQINGSITDSSGGVIPGVTVRAIEVATGIEQSTVSGANGRYGFPSLRPTEYTIVAEISGFRTYRRQGIVLLANQNLTVNVQLELGELSETVTVAGAAAQVDISSATIAEVVDHARIVELPIAARDVARLTALVAGTVVSSVSNETGKSLPGAVRISSNGGDSNANSYRLDGANNTDPYFQENNSFPFPDALQEFSIQTSNYSAAHGNNAGAVVNAVTRSGTNAFHGGTFEFLRDRRFNARDFFALDRDFLKRHQYGGYLGGPIKRNRAFFFAGWQHTQVSNQASSLIRFVPTAAQRAGDFSSCVPACPQLRDPKTGQPFPNNQIPVSMFDPASVAVMKMLPVSSSPDGRVNVPRSTGQDFDQIITKLDYQWRTNDQFSARYFIDDFKNAPQFVSSNVLSYTSPSLESTVRNQNLVGTWKRTMSATRLNEFTFGYQRIHAQRRPSDEVPGIQDFGVRLPIYPTQPSISEINASGFFNIGDNLEAKFPRDGFQFTNRLNWSTGSHSMMFGAELEYQRPEIYNEFRRAGHFVFNGQYSGHVLSDFVLGKLRTFDQGTGEYKNYRQLYQTYFAQDDFRLHDRVTVNLGVRFEPTDPWYDQVGRWQYFSMDAYEKGIRSQTYVNAPPGLLFRGDRGFMGDPNLQVPDRGTRGDYNNLAARTGMAWDINGDGRTSLRGGVGMFYDTHLNGDFNNGAVNTAPWSIRLSVTEPEGPFSDPYRGRTDFNTVTVDAVGSPTAPFPAPVLVNAYGDDFTTPLTYNFNLTFEREVVHGWTARTAYVGSRITAERTSTTLNPAVYTPGGPTGNPQARRPMPDFSGVTVYIQEGEFNYDSMQLTLIRRYARGFTVNSNYTLARRVGMGSASNTIPWFHPDFDRLSRELIYGPSGRRHRTVTSFVWDMPGPASGILGQVVGGWQVSGVYQWQSGSRYTVSAGTDTSGDGLGGDRAILTGEPLAPPAGSDKTVWFNPAAFGRGPAGSFGTIPNGAYIGPSSSVMDLGLFKRFRIRNDMNFQFRAEFFNLLNTVNFSSPNTTVGSASFGRITSAADPRIMQFGLKFLF